MVPHIIVSVCNDILSNYRRLSRHILDFYFFYTTSIYLAGILCVTSQTGDTHEIRKNHSRPGRPRVGTAHCVTGADVSVRGCRMWGISRSGSRSGGVWRQVCGRGWLRSRAGCAADRWVPRRGARCLPSAVAGWRLGLAFCCCWWPVRRSSGRACTVWMRCYRVPQAACSGRSSVVSR